MVGYYQYNDECIPCDGFVPEPGVCTDFSDCGENSYTAIPIGWNGTVDGVCEPRTTCDANSTPVRSSLTTDDTFCVLSSLDPCVYPGANFTNIPYNDRQLLFNGQVSPNNAMMLMLLCEDTYQPNYVVQNTTVPISVSNSITAAGVYVYNYSATVHNVCSKEPTTNDCSAVVVDEFRYDVCVTEFVECGCSGCIHGSCDGTSCV